MSHFDAPAATDKTPIVDRPHGSPVFGHLVDGLSAIGSVLIGALMALVCADVASRNLIDRPITGVTELVSLSIVAIVFLQLASALRHGRLSRAEIFIDSFQACRPRAGAALQAALNLCGAAFCAVVWQSSLGPFRKAWAEDDFIGVQGVFTAPTWPVLGIALLGTGLTALQFVLLAFSDLRRVGGVAR